MRKGLVRCYRLYTIVGRRHNVEVYLPFSDFNYSTRLFQCRNCRELYAADEDACTRESESILKEKTCVKCGSSAEEAFLSYPATFVTPEGEVAHFDRPRVLPPEEETLLLDLWRLDS